MKRLLLMLLLAIVAAAAVVRRNSDAIVELARRQLERDLAAAFGDTTTIKSLRVTSVFPPVARADEVLIGKDGAFARLERVDLRIALLSTLAEARPVAKIAARSLYIDSTRPPPFSEGDIVAPAFRIGGVRIDDLTVKFRMGDEIGQLSVARIRGRLESSLWGTLISADVALKQSFLRRGGQTLELGDARITGYQDAQGITIESASIVGPGRKLEISGTTPTLHRLRAELDLHDLVIIDDDFDHYSGPGRVVGEVVGPLDAPTLQGDIEIPDTRIAGRRVGMLTTHVVHQGETTRFEKAHLRGDAGEVSGDLVAKFRREIPVEGKLVWDVAELETLLGKVDLSLGFDDRLRATTVVKGQFDPLDLHVIADGNVSGGTETAAVRAESRIGRDHAEIQFSLTQDSRSRISGDLKVLDGVLQGKADGETSDLKALAAIAPRAVAALELNGRARASVLIRGTNDEPRFEGTVVGGPLSVTAVSIDDVQGSFVWTEHALDVPSASMKTQGGEAVLSGKIALEPKVPNAWRLNLTGFDTDLATRIARRFGGFPEVVQGGSLTGVVECAGPWSNPELRASLTATTPRVAGEEFARVEVEGEKLPSGWNVDINAVHPSDMQVRVVGGARTNQPARVSVTAPPFELERVDLAQRFGVTGTVALDGELRGDPAMPDGEMHLVATNLAIGKEAIGKVELRASGTRGNWRIEGDAPERRLTIGADVATKPGFRYNARLEWQELAFDYQASETDHLAGATSGSVSFEGELAALEKSNASFRVTDLHLQWGEAVIGLETPIVGGGRLGRLDVQPFSLVGKETALTVSGTSSGLSDVTMAIKGAVSLDYLELLGDPFVSTDGKVDLDMKVRRSWGGRWEGEGTAVLEHAVLDFGLPAVLADAAGRLTVRGRVAEVQEFTAKGGGGDISVRGRIDLDSGPTLEWHLQDVGLILDADLEAVVAGDGTFEGPWKSLMVRGAIEAKSALYTKDFEVVDIPALFKPRIAAVAEAKPKSSVHLDLVTIGRGGLVVDNNVAQVEVALDGKLKGTPLEPQFVGTVTVLNGKVKVRRRTFTLTAGAADFRGEFPPNPNVNITAETEISTREADYLVTAAVTGTARAPVVNFSSDDPSLTQNDLVTLVAVGRTAAELQGESGGVTSLDALALVPTAPVEERVSQLVGIDRFEIDLAQTNSQGDVSPGLTIGKNLTDRFRAALTTTFDTDARNAVVLEYDLTRRLSVLGQWEADTESEAGAFGAGLRLRYEFRRLPWSILGRRVEPRERDAN